MYMEKERYIQLKATGNNYDNTSDRFYEPEPRFSLKQPPPTQEENETDVFEKLANQDLINKYGDLNQF